MLFRDLPGILNGVECKSEYKLSPFLLHGFLFQEKTSSDVSCFPEGYVWEYLPDRYWSCIQGRSFSIKNSMNILTNYNSYMMIPVT